VGNGGRFDPAGLPMAIDKVGRYILLTVLTTGLA
jgi:hypothetical protein